MDCVSIVQSVRSRTVGLENVAADRETEEEMAVRDLQGREINYMRISITDRCNLRCKYCMPEGITLIPMKEILTYEEILRVCREAVNLGITRFKITGGEPLARKGAAELVRKIKRIPGTEQVTMTTNGVLLSQHLEELLEAGLDAVNISLDTICRERFRELTGRDHLLDVLQSIRDAEASGLRVKLNTVLQKGMNAEEWPEILGLARDHKIDVRFIEMMPIGNGRECEGISNEKLLLKICAAYPGVTRDERKHGNGPAIYYRIPGFKGSVGFISAIHGVFCKECNRIRMTATGDLKPCLCYQDSVSIRDAARSGSEGEIRQILQQTVTMKPERHCFDRKREITEQRRMVQIGG